MGGLERPYPFLAEMDRDNIPFLTTLVKNSGGYNCRVVCANTVYREKIPISYRYIDSPDISAKIPHPRYIYEYGIEA